MTDWTEVGVIAAVAAVLVTPLYPLLARLSDRLRRVELRGQALQTGVSTLMGWAAEDHPARKTSADAIVRSFEAGVHGNPLSQTEIARRQALTATLNSGKPLSPTELGELLGLLQKELAEAQAANAAIVVVALLILIGVVIVALAAASSG